MSETPQPTRLLVVVAVGLFALVAMSYWLALLPLGAWASPVALSISGVKAGLIGWYFMELASARTSIRAALAVAIFLFVVLVILAAVDVASREVMPLRSPSQGP